jgi:hypothetical protein
VQVEMQFSHLILQIEIIQNNYLQYKMIHLIEKLVTGTHLVPKIYIVMVQEVEVFQKILIIVN